VINKCAVLLFCALAALPAFCVSMLPCIPAPVSTPASRKPSVRSSTWSASPRTPALHRDAEFPSRTLAEDYVAITPLGQVTTKQETITARRSGQLRYEAMNVTDMVVRVYGDTAVVNRPRRRERPATRRRFQRTLSVHSRLGSPQRPLASR